MKRTFVLLSETLRNFCVTQREPLAEFRRWHADYRREKTDQQNNQSIRHGDEF